MAHNSTTDACGNLQFSDVEYVCMCVWCVCMNIRVCDVTCTLTADPVCVYGVYICIYVRVWCVCMCVYTYVYGVCMCVLTVGLCEFVL